MQTHRVWLHIENLCFKQNICLLRKLSVRNVSMLKNHLMYCSGHWLTDLTGKKNERIGNQTLNTCLQLFQPGSSACSRRVVLFFLYRELKHSSFLRTKQRCVLLLGGWGCVVMERVALQLVHISQKHPITVNVFQSTQIWSWRSLTFRRLCGRAPGLVGERMAIVVAALLRCALWELLVELQGKKGRNKL